MKLRYDLMWVVLLIIAITACKKEDQTECDQAQIETFLQNNHLTAQSTPSGVHYILSKPGSNEHPTAQDTVDVTYRGRFLDGVVFDSSQGDTVSFLLGDLIVGFQEGITYFGKGGEGLIIIPSELGYGSNPPFGIPDNAILLFDVQLIDFRTP